MPETLRLRTPTGQNLYYTQPYSDTSEIRCLSSPPSELSADLSTAACTPSHPNNTSDTAATSKDCLLPCRTATQGPQPKSKPRNTQQTRPSQSTLL